MGISRGWMGRKLVITVIFWNYVAGFVQLNVRFDGKNGGCGEVEK